MSSLGAGAAIDGMVAAVHGQFGAAVRLRLIAKGPTDLTTGEAPVTVTTVQTTAVLRRSFGPPIALGAGSSHEEEIVFRVPATGLPRDPALNDEIDMDVGQPASATHRYRVHRVERSAALRVFDLAARAVSRDI